MSHVTSDLEIDQLVWSLIQGSQNPNDYLNYIHHAYDREAEHEVAFQFAEAHWSNIEAPSQFGQVLEAMQQLAEGGNALACFHLGRWHRLGYGVDIDVEQAMVWYQRGADLGCTRCMISLARTIGNDDPERVKAMLEQACTLGDQSSYCYLADYDKPNHDKFLEMGAQSGDSYAMYCWGYHLIKHASSQEDKSRHLHWIERAAKLNESSACFYLGCAYHYGDYGVTQDIDTARYWLKKGAALGCAVCIGLLGRSLQYEGENEDVFVGLLTRAAMLNQSHAQSNLGWHFVLRGKTPEEQQQGVRWLRKAAIQGSAMAMYRLADALRDGKEGEVNLAESLEWLIKGAAMGSAECQCALGTAYMLGTGIERDTIKAHNLYQISSLQGCSWATYLLGLSYEAGDGTPINPTKAIDCYKEVADTEAKAAFRIGYIYLWGAGEIAEDRPTAVRWLRQAADQGSADAQLHLGIMLLAGHGVTQNASQAFKWFKQSAAQNNRSAMRELGELYAQGNGVQQDTAEAQRLMACAASMGDSDAQKWLDENCPEKPEWLKQLSLGQGKVGE